MAQDIALILGPAGSGLKSHDGAHDQENANRPSPLEGRGAGHASLCSVSATILETGCPALFVSG